MAEQDATADLTGAALDVAVGKALGVKFSMWGEAPVLEGGGGMPGSNVTAYSPSSRWAQGGPIIQNKHISLEFGAEGYCEPGSPWYAECGSSWAIGPTPLVAAMRALVSDRQG